MYKILIVEDDPMVAMIDEQYILKNHDFQVVSSCRNGSDAIDYLKANQVDLVLLDVFMPIMDGIETLKKIRELKINTEVIMVTAANDTKTLEETIHLGVLDYLIKPFAYARFQVALEKFDSKMKALKKSQTMDQNFIDSLISNSIQKEQIELPKGIQEKTLTLIKNYLTENPLWQTGDMIAEKIGISIVTIRHYMDFLEKVDFAEKDINYETGGRPCLLYKKK